MSYTIPQLFDMEMAQLAKEQGKEPDPKLWRWSPLDINEFDIMLHIAIGLAMQESKHDGRAFRKLSFTEAGSGIGTKLWLAKNKYDLTEYGYEISSEYLELSRAMEVQAEQHDLSDLDNQPAWAAYDIVYIARPFKNDLFEAKWERLVQEDMRPGAVLISAFAAVKPYTWPCYYKRPFRGVWIKPVPGKAYSPAVGRLMQSVTVP